MRTLVDEIISKYQQIKGSEPKEYFTPGKPNEHLRKGSDEEECLNTTEYRSLVGKYMYLVTKIFPEGAHAARDLMKYFSSPTEDHWKAVERAIGHLKKTKDTIKLLSEYRRSLG